MPRTDQDRTMIEYIINATSRNMRENNGKCSRSDIQAVIACGQFWLKTKRVNIDRGQIDLARSIITVTDKILPVNNNEWDTDGVLWHQLRAVRQDLKTTLRDFVASRMRTSITDTTCESFGQEYRVSWAPAYAPTPAPKNSQQGP